MATYAWTINKLYTKNIVLDGTTYTDVIIRVEATLTGTSEIINSINSDASFDLDMDVTGIDSSFIEYVSVTEANVITWIENKVGSPTINEIKKGIESEINFLENINDGVATDKTEEYDGSSWTNGGALNTAKEDTEGNSTFPWS